MSLAAVATSKTVLDTILDFLVPLILPSAIDRDAACQAALDLLSDHHPATREELRLAAEVVGFSLQALAALRDAAQPGIPISRAMRLRASACTLRRAEQAAQRKLDALQRVLQPAEPIQERAIAIAMKNAKSYFDGAYAKAREMGDALAAPPRAMSEQVIAESTMAEPTTGDSATSAAAARPTAYPGEARVHLVGTVASTVAAPTPTHVGAASRLPVSNPDTSRAPAPSNGTAGAMPPTPGRIGATLRYMKETLSQMDPNTSETGDFPTDFLAAIERGLPTGKTQNPLAPAG